MSRSSHTSAAGRSGGGSPCPSPAARGSGPSMLSGDKNDNAPHPIDVYVGGRMRLRRTQLGLSQGTLASKTGVSFQAIQKYEAGDIRISASRLYDVAQALQVSPAFFFDGYPDGMAATNLTQELG